jgi:hypothetical protein
MRGHPREISEMERFVNSKHQRYSIDEIDLADATGLKDNAPIGRQWLIKDLYQQRPIHAVVADKNHNLIEIPLQHVSQRISRSRNQILKRFTARKSKQLRLRTPEFIQTIETTSHFLVRPPLPSAIIEIVEGLEDLTWYVTGICDRTPGRNRPVHWARVNNDGLPSRRDTVGRLLGLGNAQIAERNILSPSKSPRHNTLDVPMARQNDLGRHGYSPPDRTKVRRSNLSINFQLWTSTP